jgi:hypothetical protein
MGSTAGRPAGVAGKRRSLVDRLRALAIRLVPLIVLAAELIDARRWT